jgi:adenosine kinase
MKPNIIVCGSLAYDRIMDFPGYFHDHILPDKIRSLNVCFQVEGVKEKFGGTAGNIAYALTLMGEKPLISASVGRDYHGYFEWLKKNGISTDLIRVVDDELTPSCYLTTDRSNNQIIAFNSGAMRQTSLLDFDGLDPKKTILIISPGNLDDMISYPRECKARGIDYIFDPGQSLPMLAPGDLIEAIEGSRVLISNGYELELIMSKTGLDKKGLLARTGAVITTLGDLGSTVHTPDNEVGIPTVKARQVLDPTGAGDSYRGGLLTGLIQGKAIDHCARMGSVCASFAVECYGSQEYTFAIEEFNERFETHYLLGKP